MNKNIQTGWMMKGAKCWVYIEQQSIFRKAQIESVKSNFSPQFIMVWCKFEDGSHNQTKAMFVERRNQSDAIVTNLVDLDIINDAQILYQLNQRFKQRNIFTFVGSNLLVINPYELIAANYSEAVIDKYHKDIFHQKISYKEVEPHIFGLVGEVLKQVRENEVGQAIIISGESGSGKTETNKYCLKYLTHVCSRNPQDEKNHIEEKVLSCNPILQAFGNAKTMRNDNSSRFGKLTTLKINKKSFRIKEASIKTYFLQKSRIPFQKAGELNFHVFYFFVRGISVEESHKYYMNNGKGQVLTIDSFECLKKKGADVSNSQKHDQQSFLQVCKALQMLKFNGGKQQSIWKIVAGILHLSNVGFDHTTYKQTKSPCEITDKESLRMGCKLIGLDPVKIEKSLLFLSRNILNEQTSNPQSAQICKSTKDSLIKIIYENLFLWIIGQLNLTLKEQLHGDEEECIDLKLLDIYGFEVFEQNGFQQLCVNYTNQRLHQLYIKQIFKQQKIIFQEEGLADSLKNIHFSDNKRIIELVDTEPSSLYNLLDESCTVQNDDNGLLNNIKKALIDKPNEVFPDQNRKMVRKAFVIKHTPGNIQYAIAGFRQRNKDHIREDLLVELQNSELQILKRMFIARRERSKIESNTKFLGKKIRDEINALITQIETGADVHFIRCVKPNQQKKPFTFIPKMVLTQIKYLGLLDTILLRKATYHIRITYQKFYNTYHMIEFPKDKPQEYQQMTKQQKRQVTRNLFHKYFSDSSIERLFGTTKIFLKEGTRPIIDMKYSKRMKKIQSVTSTIKQYAKTKIASQHADIMIGRYKTSQSLRKYLKGFAYVAKREWAFKKLKSFFQRNVKRIINRIRRNKIIVLQTYFRRIYETDRWNKMKKSVKKIQNYVQSFACSVWFEKYKVVRGFVRNQLIDIIWKRNRQQKIKTIEKYMKSKLNQISNSFLLSKALTNTQKILKKKYAKSLSEYFKGFSTYIEVNRKLKAILFIQSFFRMKRILDYFRNIREKTIKIQRSWRRYYFNKLQNIKMVQQMFQEEQNRRNYMTHVFNQILHKQEQDQSGINRNRRTIPDSVEEIFRDYDHVKTSKISLFYYLLDFESIIDLEQVYEGSSWIVNYYNLFKQSYVKNNPIQYLNVGQMHTIASTSNKLYSWGCNDFQQLGIQNLSVSNTVLNTINLPPQAKIKSFTACNNYSSITFYDPPSTQYFGKIDDYITKSGQHIPGTLKDFYALNSGILVGFSRTGLTPLNIPQKVLQVSCGMGHVICKTALKKVLTWGEGGEGQLGHSNYLNHHTPKVIQFFSADKHLVIQVAAASRCSMVVYSNHKIFWFGTNNTIYRVNTPQQVQFQEKSNYLWDTNHYTPIRVICTWSKTVSIIGVTFAWHYGVLPTNISLKKKVLQQLAVKWNQQNISTILPPYIRSITNYFSEKCMKLPTFKPDIQMESRKKLKEFRNNIILQLKSLKYVQYEDSDNQGNLDTEPL